MSIILVPCPSCTDGFEYYPYGDERFKGSRVTCWTCGGSRQVPEMLTKSELCDFIAGDHGKEAA